MPSQIGFWDFKREFTRLAKKDVAGEYLTYVTTTNVKHNAVNTA